MSAHDDVLHRRTVTLSRLSSVLLGVTGIAGAGYAQPSPPVVPPAPGSPAATQTPATGTPGPRPAALPTPLPIRYGPYTISIYNRTRLENFNFFQGEVGAGGTPASTAGNGRYTFLGNLLRVGISRSTPHYDFMVEVAQPSLLNLPDDATASGPGTAGQGALGLGSNYFTANGEHRNVFGFFPKQAFLRFKGLGSAANSLRLGRFEFAEGAETTPTNPSLAYLKRERIAQRLIGTFAYTDVMRSFDGAQLVHNTPHANLTFAAARATEGVFQVRGTGELDVDFAYAAYTRPRPTSDFRLFGVFYRDGRDTSATNFKTDNRTPAQRQADTGNIRIGTLGAHYLQTFPTGSGTFDVLGWGALQGGDWGSQDHRANAFALEAGYQPRSSRLRPWLRVGYFRSSGDSDPNDDKHETFFQILPTPRVYARFPFFNLMNNQDLFAQLILRPNPRLTLRTDAHRLSLSDRNDLFYSGGGAFQDGTFGYSGRPSNGNRSLANLFDLSADYQLNAHTTIGAYFGYAVGGDVIKSIFSDRHNGSLAFLEVTNRF